MRNEIEKKKKDFEEQVRERLRISLNPELLIDDLKEVIHDLSSLSKQIESNVNV